MTPFFYCADFKGLISFLKIPMSILRSLLSFDTPPEFLALIFGPVCRVKPDMDSYLKEPFILSCFFEELLKKALGTDCSFLAEAGTTRDAAFARPVMGGFFF